MKNKLETTKLNQKLLLLSVFLLTLITTGCFGNQKVEWADKNVLSRNSTVKVSVEASATMPASEIEFIRKNVQDEVNLILKGTEKKYNVNMEITTYDEGSAFARCMAIGLGQMYLDVRIEITEANSPKIIKTGSLHKNYMVGGFIGFAATMRKDITSKIGKDVAEAINDSLK